MKFLFYFMVIVVAIMFILLIAPPLVTAYGPFEGIALSTVFSFLWGWFCADIESMVFRKN